MKWMLENTDNKGRSPRAGDLAVLDWGRLPFIWVEHCGLVAPKGKGEEDVGYEYPVPSSKTVHQISYFSPSGEE